jgi:hypothetical protein
MGPNCATRGIILAQAEAKRLLLDITNYTFLGRYQNISLEVIENLAYAIVGLVTSSTMQHDICSAEAVVRSWWQSIKIAHQSSQYRFHIQVHIIILKADLILVNRKSLNQSHMVYQHNNPNRPTIGPILTNVNLL